MDGHYSRYEKLNTAHETSRELVLNIPIATEGLDLFKQIHANFYETFVWHRCSRI